MPRILLVEDDALIQKMLRLRLMRRGHEVFTADNGQAGLEAVEAQKYDAILLDMHMPVMDGHTMVRRIRENDYRGLVIAVTASVMAEETDSAIKSGCNYFLPKPIGDNFEDQLEAFLQDFDEHG